MLGRSGKSGSPLSIQAAKQGVVRGRSTALCPPRTVSDDETGKPYRGFENCALDFLRLAFICR